MAGQDSLIRRLTDMRMEAESSGDARTVQAIDKQLQRLRGAGSTASGGASARELMEHYQRQIAGDEDYDPAINPGARDPRYEAYPEGTRASKRAADNTEIDALERRYDRPGDKRGQGVKRAFSDPYPIKKQRTTKNEPVPRGTVGSKTQEELDILGELMGLGAIPAR